MPEVRDVVIPLFDIVKSSRVVHEGKELQVPLKRFGKTNEAFFNFAYQPIIENEEVIAIMVMANDVTDLVTSRQILAQTEKEFRQVVKHSPIAMCVFKGPDMRIEMVNDMMATQIFRRPMEYMIGKDLIQAFPELKDQKFPDLLNNVYHTGMAHREKEAVAYLEGDDGVKEFYFDFEYAPVIGLDGKPDGIMVTAYDVTEKVQQRKRIAEAEERIRLATKHASVAIWDLDLRTDDLQYSDNFKSILGVEAANYSTRASFRTLLHPDDLHIVEEATERAKTTDVYEYEARIRTPEGEIKWIAVNGNFIKDKDGISNRLLGTMRDITLQKNHELLIAQHSEKLEMVLEASELGTWTLDPRSMKFTCNETTGTIFGLKQTTEIQLEAAVSMIHPADREKVQKAIQKATEKGSDGRYDISYTVIQHGSAEQREVHARGRCYFDSDGEAREFTGTLEDVTEKRKFIQKNEKLHQLVSNSKDFMGMATLQGEMTYINQSGRALVGIGPDEKIEGKPIRDFYTDEMYETLLNTISPAVNENGSWSGNVRIKHQKTGEEILCHADYLIIRDPETNEIISRGVTFRDLRPEVSARYDLENSEKRFRNLVQQAPVATAIYVGKDMTIQWANDAMINLWGKDNKAIGKTVREALPELEGQPFHDLLQRVYTTGEIYQATEDKADLMVNGTLQTFYFNFSYKPLRDHEGKVYGILNMAIDVTDQVKIKKMLVESEDRIRIAATSGNLGVWDVDVQTGTVNWDNVARNLFGFSDTEVITPELFSSRVHPDDVSRIEQITRETLSGATGGDFDVEYRLLHEGVSRWIHAKGKAWFKENKAYRFAGTMVDVTEKREALEELKRSELKFRLLAESMPQIVWTADEHGMIKYFNMAVTESSGIPVENLLGDKWLQLVHPDDRRNTMLAWESSLKDKSAYVQEHRILQKDGTYRWLITRAQSQRSGNGSYSWVGTSTDVHQQKTWAEQLEKIVAERTFELNNAVKDLTVSNKELQQFAYVASHDLQEPMRKIQTFSQLITETLSESDERTKLYMEKIRSSASRMADLIRDLLQYSRMAKDSDKYVTINLNDILDKVKNDFELAISEKQAVIVVGNLPVIKAIPIQMNQLFYNLMNNALKFSNGTPRIEIKSRQLPGDELLTIPGLNPALNYNHITFKDNGIGFDNSYREKIFIIFQRLHSGNKYAGTGIGLAICKKVLENHQGQITADSEEGKGTTFNIYLPE
jgi:PAS domain S-box-containing protein